MAEAATAIGIASFGIQACRGLLSYYEAWKNYNSDVSSTYNSIADLSRTLGLLKGSLEGGELDEEKKERVKRCLQSGEEGLVELSKKNQELRKYCEPEGLRQKARSKIQRAWYPFRASTLADARDTIRGIREHLELPIQVLQLDVSTSLLAAQRSDQFRKITDWLAPPDPETNHASARQRYEPQTGTWLLQSDKYQRWKTGSSNCLWLYGKAGCGKTVLCSTVIEDIRAHCTTAPNFGHAVFYFSFSDNQKQSYGNLLRSLVAQLGRKEPGLSTLVQAYEKPDRSLPGLDVLEKILFSSIESFDEVFVLLDALDECPEAEEARQSVLKGLERLSQGACNLRVLVTSREVSDVRESMKTLGADRTPIATHAVDADIQKWVSSQLSRDRKLGRLDPVTKALIEETISQKADGMFRWAYCQLQELKKLKSTKPKYVEHALRNLPVTLDATYERMLTSIEDVYRDEALTLLRWLAYAQSPPGLSELAEAAIIDPEGDGVVDMANRGPLEDTLEILCGLVTVQGARDDDNDDDNDDNDDDDDDNGETIEEKSEDSGTEGSDSGDSDVYSPRSGHRVGKDTKIRLAHFSVKEYLESKRILQSDAKTFYLESAKEHRFLAQSCLTYMMHYCCSEEKTSSRQDLIVFPLLAYAARSWFHHSYLQQSGDVNRETCLLSSKDAKKDWLLIHQPDRPGEKPFDRLEKTGSSVYYASFVGLEVVVQELLKAGADVNAQGGDFGNVLNAASFGSNEKVVKMLIDAGAEVNAQGGKYSNALQAALRYSNKKVVEILINAGADVNT